jgi:hypothetical protein
MSKGLDALSEVPTKTSQWQEMIAVSTAHFNANANRLQAIGAILGKRLPHAKNLRAAIKLPQRVYAAAMIRRYLNQAAAAQASAAAALNKANGVYEGTFNTRNSQARTSTFDAAA